MKQIPLSQLYSLSIQTMSQTNEDYSIKIAGMVYLLPHCQGPRPWGQNAAKFRFFIFASICHIPEWIWFV